MYTNLNNSLKSKGLSISAIAKLLSMPEATFRTKLQERSFSVEEAIKIKENLFPELDIFYLFKREANDQKGW